MPAPRLIAGLGNPGAEYAETRHNVGFWFIDRLAQDLRVTWSPQTRFHGEVARVGEAWLVKPATFMNRSGQAVAALARFYRIAPDEVLVVHDDLDLPPGGIRLKQGGGNGGHNGLKDIQAHLSTPDFWRLRLGIGHPRSLGLNQEVIDFVLQRPNAGDRSAIDQAVDRCLLAWRWLGAGDTATAQQHLHGKPAPSG